MFNSQNSESFLSQLSLTWGVITGSICFTIAALGYPSIAKRKRKKKKSQEDSWLLNTVLTLPSGTLFMCLCARNLPNIHRYQNISGEIILKIKNWYLDWWYIWFNITSLVVASTDNVAGHTLEVSSEKLYSPSLSSRLMYVLRQRRGSVCFK